MERKEFLSLVGMSTAAFAVATCMGGCKKNGNSPGNMSVDFTLDLNSSSNSALAHNGGSLVSHGVLVAKTVNGDYIAVAAACTHAGYTVTYNSSHDLIYCPAHGSEFSDSGSVVRGPASTALQQFHTSLNGNSLRVYS